MYARGGEHTPQVVRLVCGPHNQLLAERELGKAWMARAQNHSRRSESDPLT